MALNHREISIVIGMLDRGDKQQDIAAYFGVNGGRISEINTGQCEDAVGVRPALENDLPPAGPIMAGRSALQMRDTLRALRDLIDDALTEIEEFERRAK